MTVHHRAVGDTDILDRCRGQTGYSRGTAGARSCCLPTVVPTVVVLSEVVLLVLIEYR